MSEHRKGVAVRVYPNGAFNQEGAWNGRVTAEDDGRTTLIDGIEVPSEQVRGFFDGPWEAANSSALILGANYKPYPH